jgi:hypothetical protein
LEDAMPCKKCGPAKTKKAVPKKKTAAKKK